MLFWKNLIDSPRSMAYQASLDKLLIREIQPRFQIIKFNKFFLLLGFSSQTLTIHRTAGKGRGSFLFHSTTSTCSRTLRHLFATLLVRWLSRIFNCNACVYQTVTRWDLPPYRITVGVIYWWCNVCVFTRWIDTRFLLQRFDIGNRWI